jgi:hypothetical protein
MNQLTLPAPARRSDEEVVEALLCAVRAARWTDGSLLVDLDDIVIRTQLVPHLMAALRRPVDDCRGGLS